MELYNFLSYSFVTSCGCDYYFILTQHRSYMLYCSTSLLPSNRLYRLFGQKERDKVTYSLRIISICSRFPVKLTFPTLDPVGEQVMFIKLNLNCIPVLNCATSTEMQFPILDKVSEKSQSFEVLPFFVIVCWLLMFHSMMFLSGNGMLVTNNVGFRTVVFQLLKFYIRK